MELFHEVKNRYFHLVSTLIQEARNGATKEMLQQMIEEREYSEKVVGKDFTTFEGYVLNDYFEESFHVLKKQDERYYPIFQREEELPFPIVLTEIEQIWLHMLLQKPQVQNILGKEIIIKLQVALGFDESYFQQDIIEWTNIAASIEEKQEVGPVFNELVKGMKQNLTYDCYFVEDESKVFSTIMPLRIESSLKEGDLKLSAYDVVENVFLLISLSSIQTLQIASKTNPPQSRLDMIGSMKAKEYCQEPLLIEVTDVRGAMERCFMYFSGYERSARQIGENKYEMKISYYQFEEAEIIRQILALGPYVRVKSPKEIIEKVIRLLQRKG